MVDRNYYIGIGHGNGPTQMKLLQEVVLKDVSDRATQQKHPFGHESCDDLERIPFDS